MMTRVQFVPYGQDRGYQEWKPVGVIADEKGFWYFEGIADYTVAVLKIKPPEHGEDLTP